MKKEFRCKRTKVESKSQPPDGGEIQKNRCKRTKVESKSQQRRR